VRSLSFSAAASVAIQSAKSAAGSFLRAGLASAATAVRSLVDLQEVDDGPEGAAEVR